MSFKVISIPSVSDQQNRKKYVLNKVQKYYKVLNSAALAHPEGTLYFNLPMFLSASYAL